MEKETFYSKFFIFLSLVAATLSPPRLIRIALPPPQHLELIGIAKFYLPPHQS
jgi:hypothetical protein